MPKTVHTFDYVELRLGILLVLCCFGHIWYDATAAVVLTTQTAAGGGWIVILQALWAELEFDRLRHFLMTCTDTWAHGPYDKQRRPGNVN
jgi:hypothetical protein